MRQLKKLKPAFWNHKDVASSHSHTAFNFARKWKLIVLFTTFMAILPLLVMTYVDFNLTHKTIEEERKSSMLQVLNYAATAISVSKDIEQSALNYIAYAKSAGINDIFVVTSGGILLTQ